MKKKTVKTCTYCKRNITESDYGVFCPSCSADYHKDCWLINNGCATEGCDYNRNQNAPAGFCPVCHTPMGSHYNYCKKCGRARTAEDNLVTYPADSEYYVPETFYEISAKLIGESSTYYLNSFDDIQRGTKKVSFNVFACLATAFWYLYRKMYMQALAIGLLVFLIVMGLFMFESFTALGVILLVGVMLACGVFSNAIYMDYIGNLADEAGDVPVEKRQAYIDEKGGTLFKMSDVKNIKLKRKA